MSKRWKPKFDEAYYCIFANGNIDKTVWKNIPTDKSLFERGNCFKTKAEAEAAAEKVKALLLSLHDKSEILQSDMQDKQPVASCKQLPKLTAEVFDRPDCPAWAKYAAMDIDGKVFYFEDISRKNHYTEFIRRPKKKALPDWCKVGAWVYNTVYKEYVQISDIDEFEVSLKDGAYCSMGIKSFLEDCRQARLRPYNAEEMKALVGKILADKDGNMNIVEGWSADIKKVRFDHLYYSAEKLLDSFTSNGKPAGVFEHLENGEWVE